MSTSSAERESKLPRWVPLAMFAGTTVAMTIPLLLVRRQRGARPPHDSHSTTAFAAVNFARSKLLGKSQPQAVQQQPLHLSRPSSPSESNTASEQSSEFSSPGPRELLSAISRVDSSTALLAGKAFGIATCIVTVGAFMLTWSLKTVMGIEDTRDFAQRARKAVQVYVPSLVSSLRKRADQDVVVPPDDWNAEQSEKRLKLAYEKGGMELWSRTALVEMEQELRYEHEKREKGSRKETVETVR